MIRHLATLIICFAVRADVWAVVPQPSPVLRESLATVERNFYYDEEGRLVFEQALFIDVIADDEQIAAWRLIKDPAIVPKRDWSTGGYVATWMDGEQVRQVRTNSVRETWLQFDPELAAREKLPQEKRRGLTAVKPDKPRGAIQPAIRGEGNRQ